MSKFIDPDLSTPAHDAIQLWLDANAESLMLDLCRPIPGFLGYLKLLNKVWECPVAFHGKPRFADMMIQAGWGDPFYDDEPESEKNPPRHRMELYCEVKPVIKSVGELIRQLRQYPARGDFGHLRQQFVRVAVVSPDTRFKDVIESQGYLFITAPMPEYGPQRNLL